MTDLWPGEAEFQDAVVDAYNGEAEVFPLRVTRFKKSESTPPLVAMILERAPGAADIRTASIPQMADLVMVIVRYLAPEAADQVDDAIGHLKSPL